MHVQIVTFGLGGASEREFLDAADQAAPAFSAIGGLLAKVWLENAEDGRYGAVYFWDDREAMERAVQRHGHLIEGGPAYSDAAMEHFSVLENLTRQTQPVLDIVEAKAPAPRRAAAPSAATRAVATGAGKKPTAAPGKDRAPAANRSAASPAGKASAPAAKRSAARPAGKASAARTGTESAPRRRG